MRTKAQASALSAPEPLLVSTKQAAALLSVSDWEIRRLCRKNLLAYRRLGQTKWLISFRSLKHFAEGCGG